MTGACLDGMGISSGMPPGSMLSASFTPLLNAACESAGRNTISD